MEIRNLIYKDGSNKPVKPKATRKERSQDKNVQRSAEKSLTERVENYNLISSIAQENKGINLGQVLTGDTAKTAIAARCIFRGH